MVPRVRGGEQSIKAFREKLHLPDDFADRPIVQTDAVAEATSWLKTERPRKQNSWPALTLALIAQAESLLGLEGVGSIEDVFEKYPPTTATASGDPVNTLNFSRSEGSAVKLRPFYNKALMVIRNEMLREHPNDPGHATQSWPSYRHLIDLIFAMKPEERRSLADVVWVDAVLGAPELRLALVRERVVRPFEFVLANMPTSGVPRIQGGALLQGLTFGYMRADSPNLILESQKVNSGSSKTQSLGDVGGFRGSEPELGVEVKDMILDSANVGSLDDFLNDIVRAPNATSIVVCQDITDIARTYIEERNVTVLSMSVLIRTVSVWDLPKQQEALRGVDYFLGRIQKSATALTYFRNWLTENGLDSGMGSTSGRKDSEQLSEEDIAIT